MGRLDVAALRGRALAPKRAVTLPERPDLSALPEDARQRIEQHEQSIRDELERLNQPAPVPVPGVPESESLARYAKAREYANRLEKAEGIGQIVAILRELTGE